MSQITILQYNLHLFAGLWIPTKLAGVEFYDKERANSAISIFNECEADVILLQEVWSEYMCKKIIKGCKERFPYSYYDNNKRFGIMGSGLLFLSKHEITHSEFHKFENAAGMDALAYKGFAINEIFFYDKEIRLVNLHTQADTATHFYGDIRRQNILQVINRIASMSPMANIIAGDFNIEAESESGSKKHQEEYIDFEKTIRSRGYYDSFTRDNEYMENFYTWSKENSMVKFFGNSLINKRIDFCLYNDKMTAPISVTNPDKNFWIFKNYYKFRANNETHDLSDHYPLITKLKLIS